MAGLDRQVERLDALVEQVDDVKALREPHEVLIIGVGRRAAFRLEVVDVRRPADGRDREVAPADRDVWSGDPPRSSNSLGAEERA